MGIRLRKSRARTWSFGNQLGYQLVDSQSNLVIEGEQFEMPLDFVEKLLEAYAEMNAAAEEHKPGGDDPPF